MYSLYFPSVCAETGSLISQQQDKPEAELSSVKEPALLNLEDLAIHESIHLPCGGALLPCPVCPLPGM